MCIPLRIYMRNPMQIGASPAAKNSKNKEFHADEANSSFFVLRSSFFIYKIVSLPYKLT